MFNHAYYHFGGRGGRRHFDEGGGFFGHRFGGWRGGPGMRAAKMLAAGDLQLIILLLLNERPRHGYEIIKAIEEHSSGIYTPSPGMVYPALTYLEEMGYATAAAEGAKKLYSITPQGTEHLQQNEAATKELWEQLGLFGSKLARFQKLFTADEEVVDRFGSGPDSDNDWHQMKAEFRALRDELKAAIHEKIGASLQEKKRVLEILRRAVSEIRGKS
jgi:DNA-binding PadR family transcriptional regulator